MNANKGKSKKRVPVRYSSKTRLLMKKYEEDRFELITKYMDTVIQPTAMITLSSKKKETPKNSKSQKSRSKKQKYAPDIPTEHSRYYITNKGPYSLAFRWPNMQLETLSK